MTTAFVLSGGGSLGAVQVGMLRALAERGITPDLLVGTSAGALNAAFVAAHGTFPASLDQLAATWASLRRDDVFPPRAPQMMLALAGARAALCTDSGLERLVRRHVPIVLGEPFLVSALVNLALLRSAFNLLAFRMSNVVFSEVIGLLLLVLGAYGRISGNLPATSPYAHPRAVVIEPPDLPATPVEAAAEIAMREAEIAVVQHYATEDQQRRVHAMSRVRTRDARRRVWMDYDTPRTLR